MLAEAQRLLGGAPDPTGRKRLVADARVTRTKEGSYRVRLETTMAGTAGERTLEAPSCKALADAAALVLALTFDPKAVEAARGTSPAQGTSPSP